MKDIWDSVKECALGSLVKCLVFLVSFSIYSCGIVLFYLLLNWLFSFLPFYAG